MPNQIDPALEAALKQRGQLDKLNELKGEAAKASVPKQLLSTVTNAAKKTVEVVKKAADATLGKAGSIAAGTILANPLNPNNTVNKNQREIERTNAQLQEALNKQLKDPKISQAGKIKAAQMMASINPEIVSSIPQLQHTNKEIWSEAGKLALLTTMAGSGALNTGLKTGQLATSATIKSLQAANAATKALTYADRVAKFGKVGQAMNLVQKFGAPVAADFLAGASYGVMDAAGKNKSLEDIKKDALVSGGVNAAAPIALGLAMRGLGYALKATGRGIQGISKTVKDGLENYALGTSKEQRLADATNLTQEYNSIAQPIKTKGQELAGKVVKGIKAVESLPQKLMDAGAPLKKNWDSYLNYRVGADRAKNAANSQKSEFINTVIKPYEGAETEIKARMLMLDQLDRARLGNKTAIGKTASQIEEDLMKHTQAMTDAGTEETIQKSLDAYNDFNVKKLQELVDAGYLDKNAMNKLIETHPNYILHEVVVKTLDDMAPIKASNSANPSKSPVVKAEGSERAITDPWEATFNRLDNHYKAIENAKLTNSVIEGGDKSMMTPVRTAENVRAKQDLFKQWKDVNDSTKNKIKDFARAAKQRISTITKTTAGEINKIKKGTASDLQNLAYQEGKKSSFLDSQFNRFNKARDSMSKALDKAATTAGDFDFNDKTVAKVKQFFNDYDRKTGVMNNAAKQLAKAEDELTTLLAKKENASEHAKIAIDFNIQNKNAKIKELKDTVRTSINDIISTKKQIVAGIKGDLNAIKEPTYNAMSLKEQGMAEINRWKDGVKETWLVPEEIATAVKHLDDQSVHPAIAWYGKVNNLMKEWTTGKNLPFGLQNKAKDTQSAYINADAFIRSAQKRLGIDENTMVDMGMSSKQLAEAYGKEGGFGADIFSEYSGQSAAKSLQDMRKSGLTKVYAENSNPFKVIENINKKMEQSTRLQVFKKALESGLPPEEAILVSRDASVDFQKMGTAMKWMNQIVPFLNARVQGAANMSKAINADPMGVGRRLWWTTTYPQVALHAWNRQFESEKNISDNIKKNYWTIIVDEDDAVDQDGRHIKVPITVNIKKGEWQALSTIPTQMFLDKLDGKDPRKTSELLYDVLGSVSPISSGSYNKDAMWTAPIAAMGPVPKALVGLGTNVDPYSGIDIVPQDRTKASPEMQYSKYTPELIKELAGTIGVSPARMEFVINSFGAVPKQLTGLANISEGLAKGEGLRAKSLSDSPMSKATKIPGLDSFLKESGYIGSRDYKQELGKFQEIESKKVDIDLKNKEKADNIIDEAFRIPDRKDRLNYLQTQEKVVSKEVVDKMRAEYKSRNAEGYLRPGMDQEVVAKFIYKDIQEMFQNGVDKKEVGNYLKSLEDKKIIGATAKKEIAGYLRYGKYIDQIESTEDTQIKTDLILDAVRQMKQDKVENKYITIFLDKNRDDGYITEETLPLIRAGIQQIKKESTQ